jgi:hypothetical protein
MAKPMLGLLVAVLVVIAAAKTAYNVSADTGDQPVNEAWAQNRMQFTAWNNEKWTAWIHDGAFEHLPQNAHKWHRHSNASVAFTNWAGEAWQAKIDGDEFLLAYQGNWQGPVERADAIRYRDWSGNKQLRTVTELLR